MASATPITDPERVREWAEARGGRPACVKGTTALLRIDFGERDEKLQQISWDQWVETFERRKLAALIQEDDERSRFFKLVDRRMAGKRGAPNPARALAKTGWAGASRAGKSSSKRASASGRTASAGTGRKTSAAKGRKASAGAARQTASRSTTRKSVGKTGGSSARSGSASAAGRGARAAGGGRGMSATPPSSRKR